MEKFKIIPPKPKRDGKTQFLFLLDNDLQHWVRKTASANNVGIGEAMRQIIVFAKRNSTRSRSNG